jgi:uncharacterized membrane protein YphA (DoxX/SURF4 family)
MVRSELLPADKRCRLTLTIVGGGDGTLGRLLDKGELAVVYCFVFLYIASRGSGPLSLDRALGRSAR